ncbi:TetR/AcrR family transcriptional regulator [Mucilaginibacter sp. KACC 22063]|uniref:TetR/AcrR family transcriptional regulator n=1 Tax=Mucilaginibacter sp. KACC 22063 TaxID=3025666 RepID=UPI0023654D72|nr:TetR/AcrR family transcriptional regulator [Mucilaginibacter sp. KACC 22063]WDF54162.1 TetR/AcrR family transcriptional regulator [Mucilaginibacter sp. KACC 22063]
MATRDTGTEQRIKDTAKRIFFAEGRLNATTQDIADAAGVSRTLVNYYYRSVDALIQQVYKEAMLELGEKLDSVMESDMPFKSKIEHFIEVFSTQVIQFPYQETFLVKEMNADRDILNTEEKHEKTKKFLAQIQAEMSAGTIEQMNPIHFMMNLFSLMAYPIVMKPMFEKIFKLDEDQFRKLIEERKKVIFKMLFR